MSANTLGRYHIIREIARSNDIVYEAMDPTRGKKIALKELQMPSSLAGRARQERIERFSREARAAALLQHPNIVHIFDYGQVGPRYYIAMEFLEGKSLRDLLRQRAMLPVPEALRLAAAVAEGLEFAHSKGVVHRDVKPDNVHLEPDGRVVITDFGIARLTFEPTLTADGQIFGTPSYMSPEQVTGKGIDKRSDLFSLGVMLYEMIAGRKPFSGDSVITITYNIMNMELPPVPGAPAAVDQIIRHATAKEPGRRYRSAREMAEDLRLAADGKSPRHAAHVAGASSTGARPAPAASRPAPNAAAGPPRPTPPPPSGGARPLPQPLLGGPAYPTPGAPPRGARPASRPFPPGAPAGGARPYAGAPAPPTAPPMPAAMQPPRGAVPPAGAAPLPVPVTYRPRRRGSGGDAGWLFGWLAVAVVIGILILTIVWSGVTAYERFGQQQTAEQTAAQKRDAVKAANSAYAEVEKRNVKEAEARAREAIKLQPAFPPAWDALGRALAMQDRTDEAAEAFDRAMETAAVVVRSGAPPEQLAEAERVARGARDWKALALYNDGTRQLGRDVPLARRRFEETIRTAPGSTEADNAKEQLRRLPADTVVAPVVPGAAPDAGAVATPGVAPSATQPTDTGPPSQPADWDVSYKQQGRSPY